MLRIDCNYKKLVIKRSDQSVQNVPRSRVVLAHKTEEDGHNGKETVPLPIEKAIPDYHVSEESNHKHETGNISNHEDEEKTDPLDNQEDNTKSTNRKEMTLNDTSKNPWNPFK